MEDLYRKAMNGIGIKVAMQEIRKVTRGKLNDGEKLAAIMGIVDSYKEDWERNNAEQERRELLEEEERMRKEKIDDMFEGMTEGLDKLTIHKKGDGK